MVYGVSGRDRRFTAHGYSIKSAIRVSPPIVNDVDCCLDLNFNELLTRWKRHVHVFCLAE